GDGGQPQQQLAVAGGNANDWQMFHDEESADEPIPWWYNSVTGESTWDYPTALTAAAARSTSATGVNEDEPKAQHMELAIVETVDNSTWTQLWSEEYQQVYYYFNEVTQEASWDDPATEKTTTATEENWSGAQGKEGGDGGAGGISASHQSHGSDVGSGQNQPLVPYLANSTSAGDNAESQFPFYVNERGNRVFCVPRRI
ncbi:unnamed protein product, partial [Ectocarpus sp. 13 AM-2016]